MSQRCGRILIVEDEVLVAWMTRETLQEAGFDVVGVAADHPAAVDAALAQRPDLVLMDIRLAGGTSGISAAIEIFEKTGIRAIFVTATGAGKKLRAEPAQPLGWLAKPYDPSHLVALVGAALADMRFANSRVDAASPG
jgi:CheY-like chemotaxis protein